VDNNFPITLFICITIIVIEIKIKIEIEDKKHHAMPQLNCNKLEFLFYPMN
jgi:hypothetical protein